MFQPLSAMPAGLVAHLRTPEAMFNAQTQMFARYHVTDVASFYKNDNLWTVPIGERGQHPGAAAGGLLRGDAPARPDAPRSSC